MVKDLEYGVVKEFKDTDLWYEPITDVLDGFVLRKKNQSIVAIYPEEIKDCNRR